MRRRLLAAVLWFAAAAVLALPAAAQPAATSSIAFSDRSLQIDGYLERGQQLELQRRWGEALAHYEEGLRQFPDENTLEKHFELARLHYDLGRRYADHSFSDSVSRMPAEKALDLYVQVLAKIETHYVEVKSWKDLVERGTSDLETALGEPVFLEREPAQG